MKVSDLIKLLTTFDPNLKVVAPGYENGFDEVVEAKAANVVEQTDTTAWYDGRFEESSDGNAVLILDTNRRRDG